MSFWQSEEGILQRLDMLAHSYAFDVYGQVIQYHADEFVWLNHPERSKSGTCDSCFVLDGSIFRREELPDYPYHPYCVCDLEPLL